MSVEKVYKFKNDQEYKALLNMSPSSKVIKKRSLGQGRFSKYLPLFEQQATADFIFEFWNVHKENITVITNEIVVTVTLQYQPDYPGADIHFCTGSASKAIQCSKGSSAELFPQGKITNSLEYCLPAARAAAISNAFLTLGNLLGRNLNRDIENNYHKQSKAKTDE